MRFHGGTRLIDPSSTSKAYTALAISTATLILLPTLGYRFGVDQSVFAFLGAGVLNGNWPYVSAWEGDYPGLMFLQAAEIFLFGKSIAMFRFFDLLVQLLNAYLIFKISNRLAGRAGALIALAVFGLLYQGYGPWNTAQREGFSVLFALSGYWLYLTADRRPASLTAVLIGLGIGCAFTIKPTLLCYAALYTPLLLQLRRNHWPILLWALAGTLAPPVTFIVFYWAQGALRELYEACIAFQPIYTNVLRGDAPLLQYWFDKFQHLGRSSVWLAVAFLPFLFWGTRLRERWMLFLGYLGTIFAVFVQGTFAGYHYIPGLALGAIMLASMYSQLAELFSKPFKSIFGHSATTVFLSITVAIVVAAAVITIRADSIANVLSLRFLERPQPGEYTNAGVFDFTESWDVAEYLESNTKANDKVQIWGYEPLVYYLAGRWPASRFYATYPLVIRTPGENLTAMQLRWRDEFMGDVMRNKPAYIAVLREDNWWWSPGRMTSQQLLNDFPEWKLFIENLYVPEREIGRFTIYRHEDRVPGSTPSA